MTGVVYFILNSKQIVVNYTPGRFPFPERPDPEHNEWNHFRYVFVEKFGLKWVNYDEDADGDDDKHMNLTIKQWDHREFGEYERIDCGACLCCDIRSRDFAECEYVVLVISSHGTEENEPMIIMSDGYELRLSSIVNSLSDTECPSLAGKTRIIVVQACRDHSDEPGTGRDKGVNTSVSAGEPPNPAISQSEGDQSSQTGHRPRGDQSNQERGQSEGDQSSQTGHRPGGDQSNQARGQCEGDQSSQTGHRPRGDQSNQAMGQPERDPSSQTGHQHDGNQPNPTGAPAPAIRPSARPRRVVDVEPPRDFLLVFAVPSGFQALRHKTAQSFMLSDLAKIVKRQERAGVKNVNFLQILSETNNLVCQRLGHLPKVDEKGALVLDAQGNPVDDKETYKNTMCIYHRLTKQPVFNIRT